MAAWLVMVVVVLGGVFIAGERRWRAGRVGGGRRAARSAFNGVRPVAGVVEHGEAGTGDVTSRAGGERHRRRCASTGEWQRRWHACKELNIQPTMNFLGLILLIITN